MSCIQSFWLDLCPIELSEELQQLQDMARKFCYEEIIPVAAEHDRTGEVNIQILFKFYYSRLYCLEVLPR